jgi:DNA adenine methylase
MKERQVLEQLLPIIRPDATSSGRAPKAKSDRSGLVHIGNFDALRERAALPHSASPRPFLRWVGSKRYLLGLIIEHLPRTYGTYFEPFLGAASLYFLLQPSSAVLSDKCIPLMQTYEAVRDNVGTVIRCMNSLSPTKRAYYKVRSEDPRGRFKRAANFIYLNYACWNGLYRVNSLGKFNVPFGRPKTKNLADPLNLQSCARSLGQPGVSLISGDFEDAVSAAIAGDLVYFDPPYVTKHNSNGFRDYNESLFHWFDQVRLASVAADLVKRGVHVLVSNARHADIEALYPDFMPVVITRKSTLASNSSFRGRTEELLLVSRAIAATEESV